MRNNGTYLRDYMMRRMRARDGRNPYGSRGGYVVSDRTGMRNDYGYDMAHGYDGREYPIRMGNTSSYGYDHTGSRRDYEYDRQSGSTYYPIEVMGRFDGYYGSREDNARGRDYNYDRGYRDYGYNDYGEPLPKEELDYWADKLMKEIEEKDKPFFSRENIKRKAKEMGIQFDKFSEDEFYVTTLMIFTDYHKTLGTGSAEIYLKLAKDWLCDEDVAVKYGDKLATYFMEIVEGM